MSPPPTLVSGGACREPVVDQTTMVKSKSCFPILLPSLPFLRMSPRYCGFTPSSDLPQPTRPLLSPFLTAFIFPFPNCARPFLLILTCAI